MPDGKKRRAVGMSGVSCESATVGCEGRSSFVGVWEMRERSEQHVLDGALVRAVEARGSLAQKTPNASAH